MKQKLFLFVLLSAVLLIQAEELLNLVVISPPSVKRGDAAQLSILMPERKYKPYTMSLTYKDKWVSPTYYSIAVSVAGSDEGAMANLLGHDVLFIFSVPINAALGDAVIKIFDNGSLVYSCVCNIEDKNFTSEDLHLNPSLTSIKTAPDPKKTEQAQRYQAIIAKVDTNAVFLDEAFVRPVESERITTEFGLTRRYVYSNGQTSVSYHNGIDYGSPLGSVVVAAGRGRVVMAELRIVTGNTVIIEHLPGMYTIYMHLDSINVQLGDIVKKAAVIGKVGKTGLATGPHLHWELRIMGLACDPASLINFSMPSGIVLNG